MTNENRALNERLEREADAAKHQQELKKAAAQAEVNMPRWYCVKVILHNNGKIEAGFVVDEKTGIVILMRSPDKPLDGVFETTESTTYYSYFDNYADAKAQIDAARAAVLV